MSGNSPPALPVDSDYAEIADADEQGIDPADNDRLVGRFYRGLIVFLDRVRGRGTIRSFSGREIHFEFPFVAVIGAPIGGRAPGIDLIRQGDTVGFDVGWTSKGLRVTRIKPLRIR
ncbi:MAG TPA: hypothetical protein VKS22_04925 [Candidatus Binataceae bacterium]|nr:hypothetical protein [Candidatus Binataceae bacterium]